VMDCKKCPGYPNHEADFTCSPEVGCMQLLPYYVSSDDFLPEHPPLYASDGYVASTYRSTKEDDYPALWMLFGSFSEKWGNSDMYMCKSTIVLEDTHVGTQYAGYNVRALSTHNAMKYGLDNAREGRHFDDDCGGVETEFMERDRLTINNLPAFTGHGLKITSTRKKFHVAEAVVFTGELGLCADPVSLTPLAAKSNDREANACSYAIDNNLNTYFSAAGTVPHPSLWVIYDFKEHLLCGINIQLARTHIGDDSLDLSISVWNSASQAEKPTYGEYFLVVHKYHRYEVVEEDLDIKLPAVVAGAIKIQTTGDNKRLDIAEISLTPVESLEVKRY